MTQMDLHGSQDERKEMEHSEEMNNEVLKAKG